MQTAPRHVRLLKLARLALPSARATPPTYPVAYAAAAAFAPASPRSYHTPSGSPMSQSPSMLRHAPAASASAPLGRSMSQMRPFAAAAWAVPGASGGATRTETDLLGPKEVPVDAFYGIATQRAVENYDITGRRYSFFFGPNFMRCRFLATRY